jgi:predicted DNA-binding transcriptional regulator YafY
MPRYQRVEDLLHLALALQEPGPGLSLDQIQQRFGVGRRTAERMRETIGRVFPGLTARKDADGRKRWMLPPGAANGLVTWSAQEVATLARVTAATEREGDDEMARGLRSILTKVRALAGASPKDAARERLPATRAEEGPVGATASPIDVAWRIRSEWAGQAMEYRFHPDQMLECQADGSVVVRFRTRDVADAARHLLVWGDRMEMLDPPVLKETLVAMIDRARQAVAPRETRDAGDLERRPD